MVDPLSKLSWDWIKSFVAVARHGSAVAAAQQLGTNAATVSRQITALEKQLGVELFVRSRQGMQCTLPALQFLAPAQSMQQAMQRLSMGVAAKDQALRGLVRISASVSLANFVLPDLLSVFRGQHPGIQVAVVATDAVSNLAAREVDIAIRLMQPAQSELIARRVAWFPIGLYASHGYLARRGVPKLDLANLLQHDFVDVAPRNPLRDGFCNVGMSQLADRIACTTSDHSSAWQMVRAGMGIGSSLKVVAERDASVAPVLTDLPTGRFPVWLVTHKGLRQQPRLRVVVDYLSQAVRNLAM